MEETLMPVKLKLNKKVISKLETNRTTIKMGYTDGCTFPECASEPLCKTDQLASCAPCVPPTRDPNPQTRNC